MKKGLKNLICMFLSFSLFFCVAYAADGETPETDADTRPVFVVEMNDPAQDGGELVISVSLKRMPSLIAGGSLGLKFAEDLGEYEFKCEFPAFEPLDTTGKNYHFFHFMEEDAVEGVEINGLTGIDAVDNPLLLCTYTFKDVASSANVTKASVSLLLFDLETELTGHLATEVIDDAWQYDDDGVGCYQGVPFEEGDGNYEAEETFHIYLENTLPEADSVAVSGKVRSYDPKKITTVKLIDVSNPAVVYTLNVFDTSGKGRKTQDFQFESVIPGTYRLEITKPTHVSYTKKIVEIGTEGPITLTGLDGAGGDTATLLCGDIDGNGFIKFSDRNLLLSSEYYGKKLPDDASMLCDLDGDGYVKLNDLNIMMASENYNKGAVIIP